MANKIVKIPVADIKELQSDGKYILRYRIASKDRSKVSDWSELQNISFPLNKNGQVSSFYELYAKDGVLGSGRPILSDGSGLDPHPTNPYSVSVVKTAIGDNFYITSNITYAQDDSKMYTYSWKSLSSYPIHQEFDVYLSWKYTSGGWSDWSYAGTTTSNTLNFVKPDSTAQYVQAAVFLSSYPKLTNIFDNEGEVTFISISDPFITYQDVGASTLSAVTTPGTGGKYFGTITSLSEPFPTGAVGRRIFSDTGLTGDKVITVKSRASSTSIVVESSSAFGSSSTTTALSNLRL